MPCCVAFGCSTKYADKSYSPPLTFHLFPADEETRNKWVEVVGREKWEPSKHSRLCSKHFKDEDFDRSPFYNKLKKGAVPSIFDAFPEHIKPKRSKKRKRVQRNETTSLNSRSRSKKILKKMESSRLNVQDLTRLDENKFELDIATCSLNDMTDSKRKRVQRNETTSLNSRSRSKKRLKKMESSRLNVQDLTRLDENKSELDIATCSLNDMTDAGDQRTTELTFDGDYSESGTNSPTSNLQQPPTKKLKEADPVERQNELLKLACDLLSTSSKPEESNEFLDIGKVWGTKLMSLDPMQRRFAEKAINEILFEADLGTLHRDSVKINCNPKSDPFENI